MTCPGCGRAVGEDYVDCYEDQYNPGDFRVWCDERRGFYSGRFVE